MKYDGPLFAGERRSAVYTVQVYTNGIRRLTTAPAGLEFRKLPRYRTLESKRIRSRVALAVLASRIAGTDWRQVRRSASKFVRTLAGEAVRVDLGDSFTPHTER